MRRLGAILGLALALALALAFAQPASADGVGRTYPLSGQPRSIAIDPTDGRMFVANLSTSQGFVSVVDPASGQVTDYPTSGAPNVLALDSVHDRLYVSHFNQTLDVFDTTTMTLVTTLPVYAVGLTVDMSTQRVYAAGGTVLTVIDGATNTVLTTRPALDNENWFSVAVDPALHRIYVTNYFLWPEVNVYPSLIVLDDRDLSIITELVLPVRPRWGLAVDQQRHRVYVAGPGMSTANNYLPQLLALDGASLAEVGRAAVPGDPAAIAFGGDRIYVTSMVTGYTVVDANTLDVVQSVSTYPLAPFMAALDSEGRFHFGALSNFAAGSPNAVVVVDPGNHAPVISSAFFHPSAPTTSDVLSFHAGVLDGDFGDMPTGQRDPLTLTHEWTRNGSPIPASGTTVDLSVPGAGDRGDEFTVRVTATDPEGLTATLSASVVITNAVPTAAVSLSSATPGANDVLVAIAAASDVDGDPVTLAYEWLRNGVVIPGDTAASLDLGAHGDLAGTTVTVRVTASDGHGGVRVVTATALVIPTTGSFLYMKSQPGDYIGQGAEKLYSPANNSFIEGALPQGGTLFHARVIQGNFAEWWNVDIAAPVGQPLGVGSYTGAMRAPFRTAGAPGLSVTGTGRGCNTLTGRFDVTALAFNEYGEVSLFDATFEQHCEGASPALLGRMRLEVPPPTPRVTMPAGTISIPTSGNFLYVIQPQPAGGNFEQLYTPPTSTFHATLSDSRDLFHASVINSALSWSVDIAAPPGQPLAVGSYLRAVRAAFRPAGTPGLDITGGSAGCNEIKGRFDIDEVSFAPTGELLTFLATFEQWCDASITPRYGRIRIENAPPGPLTLPAGALTVPTTGTFLYLNSQPGDYVGAGTERLYASPASTIIGELSAVGDYFKGAVGSSFSFYQWRVDVAAPPGQLLAVGSYTRAVRAVFRPAGSPGLDVFGDGRGCNTVTGRFNIDELTFWSNGDVRVFQATFEQHCSGAPPALFGRIRFEGPAPVTLSVALSADGTANSKTGTATVSGTMSCSRYAVVNISGTLTQVVAKKPSVTGSFAVSVECTAPSVTWAATVAGDNGRFGSGQATASVSASVCEQRCVTASATRSVKLNASK
jgi:DNA-binding beta-propeller fold protein YncE